MTESSEKSPGVHAPGGIGTCECNGSGVVPAPGGWGPCPTHWAGGHGQRPVAPSEDTQAVLFASRQADLHEPPDEASARKMRAAIASHHRRELLESELREFELDVSGLKAPEANRARRLALAVVSDPSGPELLEFLALLSVFFALPFAEDPDEAALWAPYGQTLTFLLTDA